MKIVLTGSLGHIGLPLAQLLHEHELTIITSKEDKKEAIKALGATPAVGSVTDAAFLAKTFSGADLVYTMIPPIVNYFDPHVDLFAEVQKVADSFTQAIKHAGVKRVIHLSSIGAHLEHGSGLIKLHYIVEQALNTLTDVDITFMRPVGFYYNLYAFIGLIKQQGVIASNTGGDDIATWVAPSDIAAAIADEITLPASHRKVRYVVSDEITCNETAHILGEAIGMPDLQWITLTNEQYLQGLIAAGMQPTIAQGMVEMYACAHEGHLAADYFKNRPVEFGKVKLKDFAQEFAIAFAAK
ncbi:NAD(P)H-binding protein [Chitinophaga sp.]|uniref:NAD(P)H-binding protein n=1 Tax=Chitinophaga sp. TaxID=1869181 RepID=UPI0031E3EFCC